MNKAFLHKDIGQTLQQATESVMLSDWRSITKEQILQEAARLRSIKAQYVVTHLAHQLEIHREVLSPLDQALLAVYLLLDTLEGRDLAQQRAIYHALLETQYPLLLACSIVPSSVGEAQVSEGDTAFLRVADRAENTQQDAVVPGLVEASETPSLEANTIIASDAEVSGGSNTWFRWTEERERQLQKAIVQWAGSLDQVDIVVTKQIAGHCGWPWRSVDYKVRRLKAQQAPREVQQEKEAIAEDAAKEGD